MCERRVRRIAQFVKLLTVGKAGFDHNRPIQTTEEYCIMDQPIEYFLAQAKHISAASPTLKIHGVLFNATIGVVAAGTVYGHKSARNGSDIRTSLIVAAHTINGFHIIETKTGSNYLLARVGPSKTFRDQWRILQEHLGHNDKALARLPKSELSTFGPGFMHATCPAQVTSAMRSSA